MALWMSNWNLRDILDMWLRMRRKNSYVRLSHWHKLLLLLWRKLRNWATHDDLITIGNEVNWQRLNILSVSTVRIEAKIDHLLILVNHLLRKSIACKLLSLHLNLMLLMLMLLDLIPCELFNVSLLEIAFMPNIDLLQILVDP